MNLIYCLYFLPLCISILYFTIIKIEDVNKEENERSYSADKLKYFKCIKVCFIPVFNIVIVIEIVKAQFSKNNKK